MNRRTQQEMEEIEEEEADYVNASRCAVDKKRTRPGRWFLFFTRNILLIAVCWLVLLAIVGLRIHSECSTQSNNASPNNFTKMSAGDIEALISEKDRLVQEKEQNIPCCPSGWQSHKSSCYQLSSSENTWQHAKEDCESKGSHLVVLNDEAEEKVVRGFGGDAKRWMGLSGNLNRQTNHWYLTTVDASPRCYENWKVIPNLGNNISCAYVDYDPSSLKKWTMVSCQEQHKWMCEMKPASICLATLSHESEQNQVNGNSTLLATNTKLKNANMKRDIQNLTDKMGNLTQAYNVSETQKQKLETQKNILTEKIQSMETNWNELNVSGAQWSIDSYCRQPDKTNCQACQFGWGLSPPSCYTINDPLSPGWKTWEEAREDCKGWISDLAVAHTYKVEIPDICLSVVRTSSSINTARIKQDLTDTGLV